MNSIEHTLTPTQIAQELAYLQLLPGAKRDEAACERRHSAQQLVAPFSAEDRTEFFAAAVAAIDPGHGLGPYRGLGDAPMTAELVEFETRRLSRLTTDGSAADVAGVLLCVMDPLIYSYTGMDHSVAGTTRTLLALGRISDDDFPGFSLVDYVKTHHPDAVITPFPLEEFLAISEEMAQR